MSEFDKKISQLTGGGASQAADEYVINRGGANYKVTGANVAAAATSLGTIAGLTMTGNLTIDTDVVVSRGSANRLGLASGDSFNLVSGSYKAGATDVLTSTTLGTNVVNSSLTSVGTLASLAVTGNLTLGADVVLSRGAADRLDLATGDSLNVVSGTYKIAGTDVLSSNTLGSGVTASSLTSVGTLSSLTVSGDLTVDTSTLKVDSANNWVGIGTATPEYKLHVETNSTTVQTQVRVVGGSSDTTIANNSPGAVIQLRNLNTTANTYNAIYNLDGGGNQTSGIVFQNNSDANNEGTLAFITRPASGNMTERMRIDSSGNLGLGVTPSAWGGGFIGFQLSNSISLWGKSGSAAYYSNNVYYDGTNRKYITSNAATEYEQGSGSHSWKYAASGTAGNNISFTAAMTLDASGNLSVIGNVSTSGTLAVTGNSAIGTTVTTNYRMRVRGEGTTSGTYGLLVEASDTSELLKLRNDGAFFTGTGASSPYGNTTATSANVVVASDGLLQRSTSSLRYKTDIQDATHGLTEVLALRPVTYKGINDGETIFGGLIAEEVDEAGLNEFVVYDAEGRPDALHYGNMVSLLVKAMQEQQAMIATLEARLEALEA